MAILRALISGTFLFAALMLANALQILSLLIFPFSRHAFRRTNRWIAHGWWGLSVLWSEKLHNIRPVFSGDDVPEGENALVIANHQSMPDIVALMSFAWRKKRLGDMKWFVKDIIKYFPGVGWGMLFLDCVFLKRNWDRDAHNIERTFAKLVHHKIPVWLMSFPEGTRLTPAKLALARSHAQKTGAPLPEHVLIPRTRGFVAAATGMRGHVDAVYDVTIGYPGPAPSMLRFLGWTHTTLHIHVRRYPIATLPADSEGLARWVLEKFREKDQLLEAFARNRHF